MKPVASLLALMLLLLGADAQVPLAQTNALALQWSYPTNVGTVGVSGEIGGSGANGGNSYVPPNFLYTYP